MIREEPEGYYVSLELKCQICGLVLETVDIFGNTAIEASHDASEMRNQVRCSAHEDQSELTQFTPDDFDSMVLSDDEDDEYEDE